MFGSSAFAQTALGDSASPSMQGTGSTALSATLFSASAASATLTVGVRLQCVLQATSAVFATLTLPPSLRANLSAVSSITATLTVPVTSPMFIPSQARTIIVQSSTSALTGSKWWNLTDAKKPRGLKDPDATIDITFDWSDWLSDIGAATISDVTFTAKGGLTSVNTFFDGTKATVFVSGGTAGVVSTIACKIKTNTTPSRTDERTVYIDIADE